MINQLELRHIQYFTVLAKTLHYGKAADELFISQSALSQQIQRMEAILGEVLFERHNRKVVLSKAGQFFMSEATLIQNQIKHSMERWQYRLDGGEEIIRIGFVASAMQTFLPSVIKEFNSKYPKVKFYLHGLNNKEQLEGLAKKQLDIGFIRSRNKLPNMNSVSVLTENLTLVLPNNHPIDEHNFESISQLKDESFILFPNEQSQMYYEQVLHLCNAHGFTPNVTHQSIHGPTIFKLVESGLGISVIPNSLKDDKNYNLRYIELIDAPQKTEMISIWDSSNENIAISYFLEILNARISNGSW